MAQLIMQEEASDPTTPGSGKWTLYPKSTGLYLKDDAGVVLGPFVAPLTTSDLSPTTANITGAENTFYRLNLSGLTANRNLVLPAPSAAGKQIMVKITVSDDTYKLGIIGNTGVTINSGTAATLWRYLQRKNETVTLISTSTTNWDVVSHKINETASAYCSAAPLTQAITASTWTKVTTVFNTSKDQQGWWSDANKRFTLPEGRYIVSGHIVVNDLADQSIFIAMVYKNGSQEIILGRTANSGTGLAGTGGTAQIESDGDDYFEIYVFVGDDATVTSNSIIGYCHFDIVMVSP